MSRQPTRARSSRTRPRRRLSAEQRRETLLRAAMSVFAARGYEGTGTKDIARAAGVSEALIYGHFNSKQALHAALLQSNSEELLRHLRAATAEEGPDDGTLFRLGL